MENASKALLIAGAILLVIAIIAIGVGIVSKTRGTIDTAGSQIDGMAVQMHNKQFEHYEGTGKTYEEIKQLIADVVAYNASQNNSAFEVTVYGKYYLASGAIRKCCTRVKNPDNSTTFGINDFSRNCQLFISDPNIGKKVWNVSFSYNSQGIIKEIIMIKEDKGF